MKFLAFDFFHYRLSRKMASLISDLPPLILNKTNYVTKGKFLRSNLMRKVAKTFKVPGKNIIAPASILELIHTCTLIHDDVIDMQKVRRGEKTINFHLKNKITVMSGDLMIASTLSEFSTFDDFNLETEFYKKIKEVCLGEIKQDMQTSIHNPINPLKCLDIARMKTGGLFALSFMVPGIIAKVKRDMMNFLEACGYLYGTVYQLIDDYKDILFDIKKNESEFKHWTYPLNLWKKIDKKSFKEFLLGDIHSLPKEVDHIIRKDLYNLIHRQLINIKLKFKIDKKSTHKELFNLLLKEITRFSPFGKPALP